MTERLAYYQQRNLEFGEAEAPIKNWLQIKHEIMSLHSPAGPRRRRKRTHATDVHPLSPAVLSAAISLAAQSPAVDEGGKTPCFDVCALVCDPLSKGEYVPAFGSESEREPFVREVEKRLGTAL